MSGEVLDLIEGPLSGSVAQCQEHAYVGAGEALAGMSRSTVLARSPRAGNSCTCVDGGAQEAVSQVDCAVLSCARGTCPRMRRESHRAGYVRTFDVLRETIFFVV